MQNLLNEIEIWKDLIGFEELYLISSFGNIKSKDKTRLYKDTFRKITGKILKPQLINNYYSVCLTKDNQEKTFRIHRLVALTFVQNPHNKPYINHKNGDKFNNTVENLEWCTQKENVIHSYKILKKGNLLGKNQYSKKSTYESSN